MDIRVSQIKPLTNKVKSDIRHSMPTLQYQIEAQVRIIDTVQDLPKIDKRHRSIGDTV